MPEPRTETGPEEPAAEAAPGPTLDRAPLLERAFEIEPREGSRPVARVEGDLPHGLQGTYYVNGPGRFRRGDVTYGHWLDGDGLVTAVAFDGGTPRITTRFVRSTKLADEEEAGRARYRTFGTRFAGDELARGIGLASPVNVSVYPFAGRLLAFGEQGLPWELHPQTLETVGEHSFGRRLNPVSPFSAHPCFDPRTGEMITFGVSFSATRPILHLYTFGTDGALRTRHRLPLDLPRSVHDFALSQRYAVFYLAPYVVDMEALGEGATLLEALDWRPGAGSLLRLVRRESGTRAAQVEIGSGYCLHLVGAFEEEDGTVVVDVIELDRPIYDQYTVPELFTEGRRARPVRYRVDPEAGELLVREELPYGEMSDFPSIDPRKTGTDYGDFWMLGISDSHRAGRKFFDHLVHLDWGRGGEVGRWTAPAGSYLGGEPVFAPHGDEGAGGSILVQRFDAERERSSLLLFDAHDIGAGPRAELHLEHPIPLGFHATWVGG